MLASGFTGSCKIILAKGPDVPRQPTEYVDPWAPGGMLPRREYQAWQDLGVLPPPELELLPMPERPVSPKVTRPPEPPVEFITPLPKPSPFRRF